MLNEDTLEIIMDIEASPTELNRYIEEFYMYDVIQADEFIKGNADIQHQWNPMEEPWYKFWDEKGYDDAQRLKGLLYEGTEARIAQSFGSFELFYADQQMQRAQAMAWMNPDDTLANEWRRAVDQYGTFQRYLDEFNPIDYPYYRRSLQETLLDYFKIPNVEYASEYDPRIRAYNDAKVRMQLALADEGVPFIEREFRKLYEAENGRLPYIRSPSSTFLKEGFSELLPRPPVRDPLSNPWAPPESDAYARYQRYMREWDEWWIEYQRLRKAALDFYEERRLAELAEVPGRTLLEKIKVGYIEMIKHKIGNILPDTHGIVPRSLHGLGIGIQVFSAAVFAVEMAVFTLFIHEEALQVACSDSLGYMHPIYYKTALGIHSELTLGFIFRGAINQYLRSAGFLVYCRSGYRAYFNAASICFDACRLTRGATPMAVELQ